MVLACEEEAVAGGVFVSDDRTSACRLVFVCFLIRLAVAAATAAAGDKAVAVARMQIGAETVKAAPAVVAFLHNSPTKPHVSKYYFKKRTSSQSRNGKDGTDGDSRIEPRSPLSRQSPTTRGTSTCYSGVFYEIDHEKLPPRSPIHLKSIRVVKVSECTSLDVTVCFPFLLALRSFFPRLTTLSGGGHGARRSAALSGVRLLLLLLLSTVAGGAAAATRLAEAACEPANLATQIALFCAPDMPTVLCCKPILASIDLGGGVPCLCRVAAQPQLILARLNATNLFSLYAACGGRLRTGGAHVAAACQGSFSRGDVVIHRPRMLAAAPGTATSVAHKGTALPTLTSPVPTRRRAVATGASCDPDDLADHVVERCIPGKPTPACCEPLLAAVGAQPNASCFCSMLATVTMMTQIAITNEQAINLCLLCGAPKDMETCGVFASSPEAGPSPTPLPSPSPSPGAGPSTDTTPSPTASDATLSTGPTASTKKHAWVLPLVVVVAVCAAVVLLGAAYWAWRQYVKLDSRGRDMGMAVEMQPLWRAPASTSPASTPLSEALHSSATSSSSSHSSPLLPSVVPPSTPSTAQTVLPPLPPFAPLVPVSQPTLPRAPLPPAVERPLPLRLVVVSPPSTPTRLLSPTLLTLPPAVERPSSLRLVVVSPPSTPTRMPSPAPLRLSGGKRKVPEGDTAPSPRPRQKGRERRELERGTTPSLPPRRTGRKRRPPNRYSP